MRIAACIRMDGTPDLDGMETVRSIEYILTDEHAASSYGKLVAVARRSGEVFGPAEIGELRIIGCESQAGISLDRCVRAARSSGFRAQAF